MAQLCHAALIAFVAAIMLLLVTGAEARFLPLTAGGQRDAFCGKINAWLRDVGTDGRFTPPMRRLKAVVTDGLVNLDSAGLESKKAYQEIGALREFSRTLVEDNTEQKHRGLTKELAARQRAGVDPAFAAVDHQMADRFDRVSLFHEQLHALAVTSKELSPDMTVFRLKLIMNEWMDLAERVDTFTADVDELRPFLLDTLCEGLGDEL
jgi:hypothetical protein